MYETVRQIPSDLATKGLGDEQMRMVVMWYLWMSVRMAMAYVVHEAEAEAGTFAATHVSLSSSAYSFFPYFVDF